MKKKRSGVALCISQEGGPYRDCLPFLDYRIISSLCVCISENPARKNPVLVILIREILQDVV